MKIYSFLAIVALLFFACEREAENISLSPVYEAGVAFNLEYNETSTCDGCDGPELRFADVITDSRCPELAECIWAGEVVVDVEMNGELVRMGLSPIDTAPAVVTVGDWTITLLNVFPYPTEPAENDDEIDPSIYVLELLVEMI